MSAKEPTPKPRGAVRPNPTPAPPRVWIASHTQRMLASLEEDLYQGLRAKFTGRTISPRLIREIKRYATARMFDWAQRFGVTL